MKCKLSLFVIVILCILLNSCSSDERSEVYEGDVFLHTQADVDDFGKRGYKQIAGTLTIQSLGIVTSESIADLTPLSTLESVDGELIILYCENLSSLNGLQNIKTIGLRLSISHLWALSTLEGLANLHDVGSVEIEINSALVSLKGLENISVVSSHFVLYDNTLLAEVPEFHNLTQIPGDFRIIRNPKLTAIAGFGKLERVDGDMQLFANGLTTLDGLENLATIGKGLIVGDYTDNTNSDSNNSELFSITGLAGLTSVGRDATICGLKNLSSLAGLENLETVGGRFELFNNNKITDAAGLSGLTSAPVAWIHDNKSLSQFCGLKTLAATNSNLTIERNLANPTKEQIVADCQ